jgi:hypothetical protein
MAKTGVYSFWGVNGNAHRRRGVGLSKTARIFTGKGNHQARGGTRPVESFSGGTFWFSRKKFVAS